MKRVGLAGVLSNPSKSANHHNGGWTRLIVSQLESDGYDVHILTEKDEWNDFDKIFFLHGVNYKFGTYNLFGGVSEDLVNRLKRVMNYKGEIISLFDQFPDIKHLCEKRNIALSPELDYQDSQIINTVIPQSTKITIGDSHSISVCPPDHRISRNDGKTLHGALRVGLESFIPSRMHKLTDATFYFGNIDIRFHVCRIDPEDPNKTLTPLFEEYKKQLEDIISKYGTKITLVHSIPIENESRKIPKSGYYKGKGFYGTQKERTAAHLMFNRWIDKIASEIEADVIKWPDHYKNEDGELSFDAMESRQSVHLRPKYYYNAEMYNKQTPPKKKSSSLF